MNWLARFMMGRYGNDQLSMALIIFSILMTWIGQLTRLPVLIWIGYIPFGISIFRILSRDIQRRRMENYKFMAQMAPVFARLKKLQYFIKESRTHRRFACPNCRVKSWVPKGKGKIIITCPKCRTEFKRIT